MNFHDHFTALLGENLTHRARSPKLWSSAFKAHGLCLEMRSLNIMTSQLPSQLESLSADENFLGGAVAAPHKRLTSEVLDDRVDEDVHVHGCVNCLYRDADMILRGANSDGVGALRAIQARWATQENWAAVLLGLGGVGRPIARELSLVFNDLIVVSRRSQDHEFANAIGAQWVDWEARSDVIVGADLIINCTSLGAGEAKDLSPLSYQDVQKMTPSAKVFDVIYDPAPTRLLEMAAEHGLEILDGKSMNLFQAEIAFAKCFPTIDKATTNKAMAAAFKLLE